MALKAIYANVSCRELDKSARWYGKLFGREPDAKPMDGLVEWHPNPASGLQLYQKPEAAGKSTLTLLVEGLENERRRLDNLNPSEIEEANYVRIFRMNDPDGNLVVLAESKS